MKRIIPIILPTALVLASALAFAAPKREGRPASTTAPERIAASLDNAGVPLSEDQSEKIAALEPGNKGLGALRDILTDEQKQALLKSFRNSPRARGMKGVEGHPRARRLMREVERHLSAAGHPLTQEQIAEFKALKPGERNREAVESILTAGQKEALLSALREHSEKWLNEFSALLDKAGHPLTQEQRDNIKKINPGKGAFGAMRDILTYEQIAALRKAAPVARGARTL